MPDNFSINYTINKLTGMPASSDFNSLNLNVSELMPNEGNFSYTLDGLTPYTDYSFTLSSLYDLTMSDVVSTSATTSEAGKM